MNMVCVNVCGFPREARRGLCILWSCSYRLHHTCVLCVCEGGVHVSVSACGAQESVSDLLGLGLEVL